MDKLNVICVDDQREVLGAVLQDLKPHNDWLNIEDCESANEAIELLETLDAEGEKIALIISDHVMPDKNGVALLTEVSSDERFKYTRKILLTGQATHSDTINAINSAGIDRYFDKPWDSQQLADTVKSLVTEYVFDTSLNYEDYQSFLDSKIVLQRLR